jgi:SAM-dependent methyltransferase
MSKDALNRLTRTAVMECLEWWVQDPMLQYSITPTLHFVSSLLVWGSWNRPNRYSLFAITMLSVSDMRKFIAVLALSWMSADSIAFSADYPEEIPFVPTPLEVIDKMLELAEVKKGDVVYDLGSGDGRIVIRAAKKYRVHGVGIEMDRLLLAKARKDAAAAGVTHLVQFRAEDALKTDLSPATVVTLYMLPWFNEKMKPNFKKYLKPGARIVAHDFGIEGWKPDKTVRLPEYELKPGGHVHYHTLFLWRIR